MHPTEAFADYSQVFRATTLSPLVLHHAKRAVIDWHASLFPGIGMDPVPMLEQVFADDLDRGQAKLIWGRQATPRAAALINGAAAHAAELDDSFKDAMYHPGAATIAAAYAAAHQTGASGLALLRGIVLGYEVSTRIGVVLGRGHYKYWHNTGTVGTFGAAAAAASILGLNQTQFAHALATAATFAAGLQQAFRKDSMSKPLHAGRAAEAGLLAAQLAAAGVTGSLDVLDGESGLGQAMSSGPDWSQAASTLGQDFHITRLTFKNHVGCGHTFAAIDGALILQAQHGVRAQDIERIHIGTYKPAMDIACYVHPQTANEARFSMHYVVATALVHGSVRMAAYEAERLSDPLTRNLMGRTTVVLDPAIDAAFPGRRAANIEIVLKDGRHLKHFQPNRKGDPEEPLSDGDLDNKLTELASPHLGLEAASALLAQLKNLDQCEDLS